VSDNLPAVIPQVPPAAADPVLAEHAHEIRRLGNGVKADLIEMGRRLKDARDRTRGRWLKWLDTELGWTDKTAQRLINVYEFSQADIFEYDKLSDLNLPVSAIYLLAAPSTPAEARTEIVEAAKAGESISVKRVKTTIVRARGRSTPEARVEARDRKREPDLVRRRFGQTLMCIRETCESMSDMVIPPDLSTEDTAEAIATLTTSMALIEQLWMRLASQHQQPDGGLDISARLRRAPANTSSAASGTPPALAAGSSNGGITTMRSE